MMDIQVNDTNIQARLGGMPAKVRAALTRKIHALALMLEGYIKADKLSGQVLNVVTGALKASIFNEVTATPSSVTARVASASDVKYAAIHEFGGVINIPEIFPSKGNVLHFVLGGKDVFARRVAAHVVHMPERSFMRSALHDKEQEIVQGISQAVTQKAGKPS